MKGFTREQPLVVSQGSEANTISQDALTEKNVSIWVIDFEDNDAPEVVYQQWMRNTLESTLKRSAALSCFFHS